MVDSGVWVQWVSAVDNETPAANLTYDLDYSTDGGASWTNITQTGQGVESWWWNTTSLPEGAAYRVRVRAFDGTDFGPFDSSGNNFSIRHFGPTFSNATQTGFAVAGAPVEWAVVTSGFGAGECNYSGLPVDRVNGLAVLDGFGVPVPFNSSANWAAWDCNLTASNYSLSFFTPPPAVNEGSGSVEGGWWVVNVSVAGDPARALQNVSFAISIPNYLVPGTEFLKVLGGNGSWFFITPALGEIDCDGSAPSFSSFVVDGLVWRACKKDLDGNGVFEYFKAMASLIPAGASFTVQAGGLLPSSSGGPGGDSGGGTSGGSNGTNSSNPAPSITPSPSISPSPTPDANDTSNETIVESTEEVNETTEILGPSQTEPGLVTLGFVSGGGVGGGFAELFDPDGNKFARQIGPDGSISFYFDREGHWLIRYGNETKEILVKKTKVPAAQKAVLGTNGTEGGGATGLFVAGFEPLAYSLLVLAALGAALAWHLSQNRVKVSKRLAGGRVRIEVSAGKALKDLSLMDLVPEGLEIGDFTKGMTRRETVTGAALKWKKDALVKGETWAVEYAVKNPDLIAGLKHAELKATDEKGAKLVVFSNEIAV